MLISPFGDKERALIFPKLNGREIGAESAQVDTMLECDPRKNNRGFSLVELLILLGILGITASLAVPMLTSSMRDMQLIADARSIATTATYAKLSAASQMTRYRLSFDLDRNRWSVAKLNPITGEYEIQGTAKALADGVAHNGIAFKASASSAPSGFPAASSTTITFNARGIPIEGARAIYLSNANADYAITVSLAGKVQFLRYKSSLWTSQ
jgi:prepilin-type N-terminal cleavage/methylation domain-containing protein